MIKVQDWVATIPDEEKHIAYVGEGKSVQKEFVLCGEGWETYENWTFFLDMAFDLESITTRDSRQVVSTQINRSEIDEATGVTADEMILKETYTVHDEKVLGYNQTDISPLVKSVEKDGIHLTWTVLRQHTVLPGKLWATLRAVSGEIDQIKKSDIMVFEVDAAICAVPATVPAISDMEQIRQQAAEAKDAAVFANSGANAAANRAYQSAGEAWNAMYECENYAELVTTKWEQTSAYAQTAQQAQEQATAEARAAAENKQAAYNLALSARQSSEEAEESARIAAEMRGVASNQANSAAEMYRLAALEADAAEQAKNAADEAVGLCESYSRRCEETISNVEMEMRKLDNLTYRRINVRDYGAVGDGVADDRQAIINAFTVAKTMLPCEVYFPAGIYGISNGITVEMAYGTGGLRVCGAGRDVAQIKYLDSYDPDQAGNMWYAIRIWPVGMPNTKPTNTDDYLHDISITGLTVYDTDPCAHAWHPSKGDPNKEETHGFDLQYIKRVSVTDCNLLYVGDEAIDICGCHDVIVVNNHVEGCPAAGTGGGAISIGDGCKGVVVSGNTVNGSAPDEVLDDGTVLKKYNFGIAVESLFIPVVDVTITDNVVTNIQGNGINLGATNEGSGLANIVISNNVIDNCCIGIDDEGTKPKQGIKIGDNLIINTYRKDDDYGHAIRLGIGLADLTVTGNTIKNIAGEYAIRAPEASSTQIYADNLLDGLDNGVYFGSGNVTFKDCIIKNTGRAARGTTGAIVVTSGDLKVADCTLKSICNTKGIVGATSVENTDIELVYNGAVVSGEYLQDYSGTARLRRVIGCHLRGRMTIKTNNAIVQGVRIESASIGNNAITISANGVVVTGCVIDTKAYNAISETSGYDGNLFANNIVRRSIAKTGAHSVSVNNIDLDDVGKTA